MSSATIAPQAAGSRARGPSLSNLMLKLIWRRKEISRADIARVMVLSRSTVSRIVSDLQSTDLVADVGVGPSRGGRRPVLVAFQDGARVILGVDVGASHVSVALTDLRGRVLAWRERGHPVPSDPAGTLRLIGELCNACLAARDRPLSDLVGIGVAVPSPVDPRNPGRMFDRIFPAWRGHSVVDHLQTRYDTAVVVDNDANLGAVAEHRWGWGVGVDDLTYLKVSTGIGAGHIIGGRLNRGSAGMAGEIGHLATASDGPPCVCGNRGCLATFAGTHAVLNRAEALLPEHPDSLLADRRLSIAAFEEAALASDPLALRVVHETAQHLGTAIAGVLNLMNPATVILGGSLARLGDLLLEPLREAVSRRTFAGSLASATIRTSALGPQSIALGAATHILDSALADTRLFLRAAAK